MASQGIARCLIITFLLFVIVNGVDVMTTMIGLQLGATEKDPETLQLMHYLGVVPALLAKFFVVVLGGFVAVYAHARSSLDPKYFAAGFSIGIIFYLPILCRNFLVIRSLLS